MNGSFLNILFFIFSTILYYVALKPKLTLDIISNPISQVKYEKNNLTALGIYFGLVVIVQFIINCAVLTSKCGGSVTQNLGASAIVTFMNWTLIFGVMLAVLVGYPGFKSAFSDVIGYFYVSRKANDLLTDLLIDPKLSNKINEASEGDPKKKEELETAADTIVKICGNTSILINQIVPKNFIEYWGILKPLMKDRYQGKENEGQLTDIQTKLFDLVVTRDLIGEAMWFIYTGLLLVCVVQYKISLQGCAANPAAMQANYQQFLENEQQVQSQKQTQQQVYTVTE